MFNKTTYDFKVPVMKNITVEKAKELLKDTHNRSTNTQEISRIAEDMLNGDFISQLVLLIFNPKGKLLDGQHRLTALLIANKENSSVDNFDFFCLMDVPDEVFSTLDQGSPRTGAHTAQRLRIPNHTQHAATGKLFWRILSGNKHTISAKIKPSNSVLATLFRNHKDGLIDAVALGMRARKALPMSAIAPPVADIALLVYLYSEEYGDKAKIFFEDIANNKNQENSDTNNPKTKLFKRLLEESRNLNSGGMTLKKGVAWNTEDLLYWFHEAFTLWIQNKRMPHTFDESQKYTALNEIVKLARYVNNKAIGYEGNYNFLDSLRVNRLLKEIKQEKGK